MTRDPKLHVERDADGVVTLTLNRPERGNAMDDETLSLLAEALAELAKDPQARIVVLRGAGRHFCTGADVGAIGSHGKGPGIVDVFMLLDELPKPTVAVVHGLAIGAGCGLLLCCDAVIATEEAAFAVPEIRLGLAPTVLAPFLVRALGIRQARRYLLCGDRLSARQALAIALVHDVCAASDLEERLRGLTTEFRRAAPEAFAIAKQALRELAAPVLDRAMLQATEERLKQNAAGPEAAEGMASLRDKRHTVWFK